jgi:polysaccharide chain length determinant protein (PEP-CTERM system associated)
MKENGSTLKPDQLVDIALKYRWFLIVPFCLAMILGMYFAVILPKIYQSSTLILVQPQRVPENYVQSLVETDIGDRIDGLSNQILSRTNLERIINEFKLFEGPEYKTKNMEYKVKNIRERIDVEVMTDSHRHSDAFTISFKGQDPERVMNVVNSLASNFINENLKMRESAVIGTSVFLEDELTAMRIRLEKVEESLKEYRKTYMGELPEQLESNLRILERLQDQLEEQQQRLSQAKIQLASLQNTSQNRAPIDSGTDSPNYNRQHYSRQPATLGDLYSQLNEMRTRYTERHPDIVRLKEQIAEIEAERKADDKEQQAHLLDRLSPEQRTELFEIKGEIASLESDVKETKKQILTYRKRVEDTPKREQELLSLRRDYQNIQTNYDSLLQRKLESEIAVNMERKQKGEQFKIIDPARLSTTPIEPDMRKLFLIFTGLGLGAGGGIIFLLEFLSTSFKNPDEVEKELELPVLGTIPQIIQPSAQRWRRIEYGLSICSAVFALVLLGSFAVMSFLGVEPTLSMVNKIVNS